MAFRDAISDAFGVGCGSVGTGSVVKHFQACLRASMRGMWDHLDPANSGVAHGMFLLWFGPCRFMLSGKEGARCLAAAGCIGWCGEDACWCQALLCISAAMLPPSFPFPGDQAVPHTSQHVGQLLPCLEAALLHGCLHGLAAGRSPPFLAASSGLPTFPGTWGFSWESQADLRKLGVSPGLGGEREQEAACQALP